MKKLLALLLACISLVCVSCGQDNPADDVSEITTEITTEEETEEETTEPETEDEETFTFVGKWQGVKYIEDGEESDEIEGMPVYAFFQIELCEDGSIAFGETTAELVDPEITWSWRKTSDTQGEFFNDDDDYDIYVLTLDEDCLIMTYEEMNEQLYLERVDEFTPYQLEEETTEKTTHEYIEDADPTAFIGKWECRKLTTNQKKQYLMNLPIEEICQLEIYDDHTAVISGIEVVGDEKFVVCDWGIVSENEIELTDNNGRIVFFTLDGDYLVDTEKDITVSLGRVEDFTPRQPKEKTTENVTHEYVEITDPTMLYGKWQGEYAIDENGDKITDNAVPMIYQLEFNEDGTLSFGEFLSETYEKGDYTWEITDSHIALHYLYSEENTEDDSLYFNGEYLVCQDYKEIYLAKVDEFMPVDPNMYQ